MAGPRRIGVPVRDVDTSDFARDALDEQDLPTHPVDVAHLANRPLDLPLLSSGHRLRGQDELRRAAASRWPAGCRIRFASLHPHRSEVPMGLTTGTRLGPYEIQFAIDAGGMGEVHKARDSPGPDGRHQSSPT